MTRTKAAPIYRCALCGRKLKDGRWVYSRHTGNRYCLPENTKCRQVRIRTSCTNKKGS